MRIANDYSFPLAESIRVHYNAKGSRGPIDVYWHDGGMRPPAIPELEEDKKLMGNTGILYVGDKGKILDGRLLPESKMKTYMGEKYAPAAERQRGAPQGRPAGSQTTTTGPRIGPLPPKFEEWIAACRGGSKNTPANFASAEALSTMINLGIAAVRAGTRIEFDSVTRKITNKPEANKYLTREYRKGWEL